MRPVIFIAINPVPARYAYCGRFLTAEGDLTPVVFTGADSDELHARMVEWLGAEREREASKDAHYAYLRSPEAIEKRRLGRIESRAKRMENDDGPR